MAASGQNRSSRQAHMQFSAPSYQPAAPVPAGSASGPGLNESGILCQARPPGIGSQTNAASRHHARLRVAQP
jgi:hypothetical protein